MTTTPDNQADAVDWIILEAKTAFHDYRAAWQTIIDEDYQGTPGLSSIFVKNILNYYATEETRLAIGSFGNRILALVLLEYKGLGRWITLNPPQAILGLSAFSNRIDKESSLKSLLAKLPGFAWKLTVYEQDPDLSAWNFDRPFIGKVTGLTTMNVSLQGDFQNYWKDRKRKLRNNIKRYFNRFQIDNKQLTFEVITTYPEIMDAVREHGDLEHRGWKGKRGTAIHSASKDGMFYNNLISDFAEHSNTRVFRLTLDGKTIASRIVIFNNNIMISLKIAYDEEYAAYAPGRLLQYLFLEQAFNSKTTKTIEFYTNANSDQLQWATGQKTMLYAEIYRNPFVKRLLRFVKRLKSWFSAIVQKASTASKQQPLTEIPTKP